MWSVAFYIIAGLGVVFLLLLFMLLAPFHVDARFCSMQNCRNALVSLWWIHPFFISFFYNYRENDYYLRIAWWKMIKKKLTQKEEETPVEPVEQIKEEEKSADVAEPEIEGKMEETARKNTQIEQPILETVEKKQGKMDNLFERIKKSRFIFFASHKKWRKKIFVWLLRIFKSFCHLVHFDCFKADIRAGVEDPAVLGRIFGYYQAISNGLQLKEYGIKLFWEPVFMKNHFEAEGAVKISSSLGRLLAPFGVAFLTFPYISTFFLWRSYKQKIKRISSEKTL